MKEKITDPILATRQATFVLLPLAMIWITIFLSILYLQEKVLNIWGLAFLPAIIFYPLTYIFADIFTEVYGYRTARKIVWTGLVCIVISVVVTSTVTLLPADPSFVNQSAYESIFLLGPVTAFATIAAFFVGGMVNDFVVAKLKIKDEGRMPEKRFVLSTFLGQAADNLTGATLFAVLTGLYTATLTINIIIFAVVFCTLWELIAMPVTKKVVKWVKEVEGLDTYDHNTDFNPFALK